MEATEETLRTLSGMVKEAIAVLKRGDDLRPFGNVLHEAWLLKQSLGDWTSNGYVEDVYETARRAGAFGVKSRGRFNLLFVDPGAARGSPGEAGRLIYVPFKFESSRI
jgi:D-glycero-alpha-D-manno-heptose-7-phosphate kinase